MSILEGLLRGTGQASNFIGAQEQRRIAAEQAAREQSDFDRERLVESDNRLMAQGRREGYILADPKTGRLRLSDTFNERLAAGDQAAQEFAIGVANRGSGNRVPAGFQIDEIKPIKGQDGVTRYAVGGANADGSRGVLTVDGSSTDSSIAKQFDGSELAGFARLAFNSRNGFLYNQNLVDLNSFQNSLDLVASQVAENIFDATQGNPEVQRAAGAVIANSETDEERVENINKLAADVGVEPIPQEIADQAKTQSDSDPESATTPAPTDNSARIAKLEKELAAIEGRKTGTSRANVRAAERKRAEIQRLKDESEPEPESKGITGRVLAGRNRASGGSPIPAQVEEVVAPVVEGKTIAEIDEAVDNGELRVDPETARAAAEDLQNEGVNSAADLAKLDPRRQAFAYAMIIASTPNDGNRRAVRDQLINVLETGVSDRGAEDRQQARLELDYQKFARNLRNDRQRINETNNTFAQNMYKDLQANFDEDGNLTTSRGDIFRLANEYLPRIQQQATIATTNESRAAIKRLGDTTLSLVMQQMAASGDYGTVVDSFLEKFRPGVDGQINSDLSAISTDGEMIFYGVRSGSGSRRQGEGVKISELRKLNSDVANLLVNIANSNEAARGNSG